MYGCKNVEEKVSQMNENKRVTSIARKINISFWLKEVGNVIGINIIIALLIMGTWMYWCTTKLPDQVTGEHYYFNVNQEKHTLEYVIDGNDRKSYAYDFRDVRDLVAVPGTILLSAEGFVLFFALFRTSVVRRKLKPLNDLAVKAEQISKMSFEQNGMEDRKKHSDSKTTETIARDQMAHLEQAISHISPDDAEQGIHTGDKELKSIEIALNNLLRNMKWGKEDEKVLTESIEALKNESQHMKELVEQLLFLARGDSGRNTLNKVKLDLNQMVSEVWEESQMIDGKHRYLFRGTDPAYMTGDIAMIKQSIRIFVQNAAKYSSDDADIILGVMLESGYVSYMIQDEGIGMESSDVVHIFERFYRSDEARNGETGGSGLGLSIAKWIIDAHSGTIQVVSRPEIGTRFIVRFPMCE